MQLYRGSARTQSRLLIRVERCRLLLGGRSVLRKRPDGLSKTRVGRVRDPSGTCQQHREGKWQPRNGRDGRDSIREKRLRNKGIRASVTSDGCSDAGCVTAVGYFDTNLTDSPEFQSGIRFLFQKPNRNASRAWRTSADPCRHPDVRAATSNILTVL